MLATNNASILPMNGYMAVGNVEMTDTKNNVFRGEIVRNRDQNEIKAKWVYFRRDSGVDVEFDQMWPYMDFESEDLLGFPFLLVPKEKILFFYNEPSFIIQPIVEKKRRGIQ